MKLATEKTNNTSNDLSEIRFMTIDELRDGFHDGRLGHFRKQYYIRSTISDRSVEEKKAALISFDDASQRYYVEVKESFIFETNLDGTQNLVSGNTRTVALLALYNTKSFTLGSGKEAKTVDLTEESFKPIPYRVYNRPLSIHELIDYQISTNDSTERHNPLDLAIKIAELKPLYESELIEQHKATFKKDPNKSELKTIAGLSTQRLCDDFKKTKAAITQYLNVANKGTEKLKTFVFEGKTSLDTANTIVQKLGGEKAKADAIDKALEELWTQAKLSGKGDESVIYKSAVIDYFADKEAANYSGSGVDSGSSAGAGTSMSVSASDSEENESKIVNRDEFVENIKNTIDTVYSLRTEDIKDYQTDKARQLTAGMANALVETLNLISDDQAKVLYETFKTAFVSIYGNVEKLAEAIGDSETVELSKVHKLVSRIATPAQKLYKELYTGDNVEASTELININSGKTEDMEDTEDVEDMEDTEDVEDMEDTEDVEDVEDTEDVGVW
jgi:hypothetical protein